MLVRRLFATALAATVSASLAACAATTDAPARGAQADDDPIVLLIGVDGLRWDALERHDAPNMTALAERGVRPEAMIPVMPSVTFTNFYSIATGLYPEDHGMISNAPYDRVFDEGFVNPAGAQEERWWHGEPIWITAERQGLPASIMFWLGSEVAFNGDRPTRWSPYEHGRDYGERVEEVLSWFDGPEDQRPRFAALYFDAVDTMGHRFGPETEEEGEAITRVDGHIGDLMAGLEDRGLTERTNVIIVSDHGMARVEEDQVVHVDDFLDLSTIYIPELQGRGGNGYRPFLNVYGEPDAIEGAHEALKDAHPNMRAWRRGETPDHFRFNHPDRGPDLFVLADAGWTLSARDLPMGSPWRSIGVHGYDPADPLMHAAFIAAGPGFPAGARPEAFENVHVYLLIACLLGLDPAPTEGDPAVVSALTGGRCEIDD